jgi:hypothetical protein
MTFKKSFDGEFAPGKPLGTRQGTAKHDKSTSAIKDRLHNDLNPSRSVVCAHDDCPSVGTRTLAAAGATNFTGKGS